jgi:hypothetical protein
MKNVVVPVKMRIDLKELIDNLAKSGGTNRNHWIICALSKVAKFKPPKNNRQATSH